MNFFSFKNSKKAMKWPSSVAHRQYVNGMFPCRSCASRSVVAHRGHCIVAGSDGFAGDGCSPMNFMSFSVEPGESFRLSKRSNQNAWHPAQTSIATCPPMRASCVMGAISVLQPGHFMESIVAGRLKRCHRPGKKCKPIVKGRDGGVDRELGV